ncbi:MAG: group II intron reverse transcriptase/maturase [Nitrospirales bacterium]|nr:MAG: group II intron reverse transcriptase/maturase [Nitrospirales bacterium]
MPETPLSASVSTRQQRIATLAKQDPQRAFMSLNHYLDLAWLHEAFQCTWKDGAPGVDGQTWAGYAENLEANLQSLLERVKAGTYRAPPVRRVHIPKGTGTETRSIGIPTLEDKVLQRAVVMLLEAIYEQDFYHGSYGYRPGRSAHQALDSLWKQTMQTGGGWVVEVDIRKFFDALDHGHLRRFLQQRVRDGVLLRLIGKWLKAGVMEDGCVWHPASGSPQGGVISPMLANVFLHYVLDEWFACEVQPRLRSRAFLIRYADDFVIGFTREAEARRVMEVLPKRFGKYGLTIHPDKTRLVAVQRPLHASPPTGSPQGERPGTFDLLGFTHFWSRSRKGNWVVKRKTSASRFTRAVKKISQWCRQHRHDPIEGQYRTLCQKLRGHTAYYRITGNSPSLWRFREEMKRLWWKWLYRRKRGRGPGWSWFYRLLERYPLPNAVTYHSVYPREAKE